MSWHYSKKALEKLGSDITLFRQTLSKLQRVEHVEMRLFRGSEPWHYSVLRRWRPDPQKLPSFRFPTA